MTTEYTIRHAVSPMETAAMATDELRSHYHISDLFQPGQTVQVYTHYDRMIVGGCTPSGAALELEPIKPTGTKNFLDRRELIAVNIGGPGTVEADGEKHRLEARDMIYVGMGTQTVRFSSDDAANPAKFYLLSAPAHQTHPTRLIRTADANRIEAGSQKTSNERTIFQYIHPAGVKTCQLVVGMTELAEGSVWNTMPCHVHDRRMEVYLYFDVPETACVFHFLGEPDETRHLVMRNEEAALSPPWSIHSGAGTSNYTFIWAMAGDNVEFSDIDPVTLDTLR
jgi:4-deoxy-L-threo-5-hexosulose-uronate ketol-isomerase